jgi:HEAT repeat protein
MKLKTQSAKLKTMEKDQAMRIFDRIFTVFVLLTLCGFITSQTATAAVEKSDIDKKLSAIVNYQRGADRQPLIAVEDIIRESQNRPEQRKYIERELAKLLESNVTLDCKSFICRQLWFIGTVNSVPAIAKLLLDEQTVDMACYAIGQNPSPEAGKALREAMDKAPPKVQVRIINLLGDRRDQQSVESLGKRVFDGDREIAEAAVAALGKIGGDQAGKILVEARAKGGPDLRLAVTDAYLRYAEYLLADGKKEQAVVIYKELTGAQEPPFIRGAAVRGLADVGGRDAVSLVVAALRDQDRMVRTTATGCVRTMQGQGVTELFAAELPGRPSDEQVLLIGALADRGDPIALRTITAVAGSPGADVRKAALEAVGKLGDASSVGFLVDAATKSTASDEKNAALNSLKLLRGSAVDDAIVKTMQNSKPDIRSALIEVLFDRNAVTAVPALLKEAANPDAKVCTTAFRALGRLADEKDLPAMVKLLVDLPADASRREAERAVIAIARKITDESKRAEAVLVVLHYDENLAPVRCSLLRVLGGIANSKSLEALRAALEETNPQVRDTAIRELANWPDAAATEIVLGIFKNTQDQIHRLLALRGLVRLLALPEAGRSAQKTLEIYSQLLSDARGPDEKKLVLSGLANVSDPKALQLVHRCLDDEAVKAEAALAVVKIAGGICGSHPDQAKAALQKVIAGSTDDSLRKLAQDVINTIEKFEDFITSWQVCGPYMQEGKNYSELFDIVFPPETTAAKDVKWILMPAGTDQARPWVLDLLKLFGGEQRVAYLRTWIHSDNQQQGRLEIGSDDGVKVWLNGSVVHANNVARPLTPSSDNVNVTLNQGWNTLLVKVTQNNLPWEFCARLRKSDGGKLEGIRIDCTPR